MRVISTRSGMLVLLATGAMSMSGSLFAQSPEAPRSDITVNGTPIPDASQLSPGPEIRGFISARSGDRVQITAADGTKSVIAVNETTVIKASKGLFGSDKLDAGSLLNGLPVTVKTLQWPGGLLASQINLHKGDLKMASMVRHGTDQRFAEQTAATEALRGRMADIDNYNIKSTTNVHFDTGKAVLSAGDKAELCRAATEAEGVSNALILVVGYTDSTGSDEINQTLSEKRASSVINYLQQACHWKPYRMLTPTGMAKADPLASNDTAEGKAQNRRVSVNVLVSKAVDGV
ncbi:MAG TPA: OmpA family protein [Novosphingobium sp.]|nr:OmpA family protein [Novosphingobium sp.]HZV09925.1 OmpA family protein [Novosphingobium sp.]